ncbi:MAG: SMC-Scp complex subunit ScpB [Thermoanaerobaculaceae bacterium]|jgi:segregation and condensation protein B
MPEFKNLAAMIEAILAVAGDPVTLDALVAVAGEGVEAKQVEDAIEFVRLRHEGEGSGLQVEHVGGGWRLATRSEHEWAMREYLGYRARARLSQAALETLAVIAYRQPITMPEISFLRGVNSAAVVRTLVERKLVVVAGRKQVVGTPLLYRTSKEFLVHFGLPDLSALPTPEEVEQVAGEGASEP